VYTLDDWATTHVATSKAVGYPGSYVDIPTPVLEAGQTGRLIFTMHWPENVEGIEHWLGRNIEVKLGDRDQQFAAPLQQKPAS
jgi:hypothetical protein